jgi:hypothetical protein
MSSLSPSSLQLGCYHKYTEYTGIRATRESFMNTDMKMSLDRISNEA